MDGLQRYILEEWAEDFAAGRLQRRELLRRTVLMAGGVALAVSILSGLGISTSPEEVAAAAQGTAPSAAPAPGVTVPPDDPALSAEMVTLPSGDVSLQAYLSRPRGGGSLPGVVVIHENRGLLEHFKDVCRRFSTLGYAALAPDLVSHEGGTPRYLNDLAQVSAILGRTAPERLVEMLNAAVRYLQTLPAVRADRIGAIGFCFGGGMTWRGAAPNADLRAAAPFYGPPPPLSDVPKIRAAVLAVYGELDARINASIPALREALEQARVVHEIVIYPGADHAFFNDTGPRYHAAAAQAAWRRVAAWFERHLKSV